MDLEHIACDSTLAWLLEKDNPSVRYFALTKLLNKPSGDPVVADAREAIMKSAPVTTILDEQNAAGYWGEPSKFYTQKYTGTVWQIMILAELGADGGDERIKKACEFILNNSQDNEGYAFAYSSSAKTGCGRHSEVIPCLTGNMLWSMIRLGYLHDERVQKGIEFVCQYQRSDDGIAQAPAGWPYDRYQMCWGRHTCHMGVVKALKALAAIPEEARNERVKKKISELAEYLLTHHIYRKSHNPGMVAKPGWLRLGFPLMYQSDILEILEMLTELHIRDARMSDAIGKLQSKQQPDKRWKLENTFNGRMITNIEVKGKPSKWITLKALYVLMNN